MTPEPFELFAIRYAHHGGRSGSDNFIGGDLHESASDLDYFIWVARRSDRVFVIDTGFTERQAAERNRTLLRRPEKAVALLGVDASAVDEVVLTHLHFDHAGGLERFPKARLHLQDCEIAYATGRCMCHAPLRHPFDVEDVISFVRRLYAGRVAFHDGVEMLAEGLSVHRIGGHSAGLQAVRAYTERGWVVIASDASHLYEHMRAKRAFPIEHSVADMMEGFELILRLADSPDHVIPGHDPLVAKLYPGLTPELEGEVVRLDRAPRDPSQVI